MLPSGLTERRDLRDRIAVFRDRADAGEVLAELLALEDDLEPLVLAIPAGGAPVAQVICQRRRWPLSFAVVSKITPSFNSEVGYGAIAFDGTVTIDRNRAEGLGVTDRQIEADLGRTRDKVERRVSALGRPEVKGRALVLVDDGLASGTTMRVAVAALRASGARRVVAAVPTAQKDAVGFILPAVDALVCANVRGGWQFAVADAYREWCDVSDAELLLEE
jgi:putative phosphoribosyl transferase